MLEEQVEWWKNKTTRVHSSRFLEFAKKTLYGRAWRRVRAARTVFDS